MKNMTLKELVEYEWLLGSLQKEYEGKLSTSYGENSTTYGGRKRLKIVLNLIIQERQKVNQQKYQPV